MSQHNGNGIRTKEISFRFLSPIETPRLLHQVTKLVSKARLANDDEFGDLVRSETSVAEDQEQLVSTNLAFQRLPDYGISNHQ